MSRIISASLSPNTESEDILSALRLLFEPWAWQRGAAVGKVESWFRDYLHSTCAVSFNSGRAAELAILHAFGIGRGDEVIVQAFTCVAVPNAVRWAGATPVFADIDASYNLDPKEFEMKITRRTKAVIVQHTFGIPADFSKISEIAKKHNLIVIEDCAHALGTVYKNKKVGSLGDAAFFSFGRDKVLSSVFGGLASIDDSYPKQITALKAYHKRLNMPSFVWIFQQLFHPVAFSIILPLYRVYIGKVILFLLLRLRLLSFPVYSQEKIARQPEIFPSKYPNALAALLLKQIKKLDRFSKQREAAVMYYGGKGSLLRFPMRVEHPEKIIRTAKRKGILIGNWYHNVIDPVGVDFPAVGYVKGSCPNAEDAATHIINLPTRISVKDAKRVKSAL